MATTNMLASVAREQNAANRIGHTNLDDNVNGRESKAHIVDGRRIGPANDLRLRGQVGNIHCRGEQQDQVDLLIFNIQRDSKIKIK